MYDLVCLAVDPPDAVAAVLTDAAAAGGATAIEADATLPGSINAGATIARLRFAGAAERDRAAARIEARTDDGIDVYRIGGDTRVAAGGTAVGPVYRVLLARVEPDAPEETVRRFERDLGALADHVRAIRSWRLHRIATGDGAFTHLLEQEFADAAAVTGDYLHHPIHWAVVDRWFDPECPEAIVRARIRHGFGAPAPLGAAAASAASSPRPTTAQS